MEDRVDSTHPVAQYVRGTIRVYDIEGNHGRIESELITVHEQFHHMLRLKSSFGIYLANLLQSVAQSDMPPSSFELQALASRFRTSDELFATYSSARIGGWSYDVDSVLDIVNRYPGYTRYYDMGRSLVGEDAHPFLAAASIEAITRFCWSPSRLADFSSPSLPGLYGQLTADQFPDRRLQRLMLSWSPQDWSELASAMIDGVPGVAALLSTPYRQLIDPAYGLKESAESENRLLIMGADAQAENSREMRQNRARLNSAAATIVWAGYDHLAKKYKDTELASATKADLKALMSPATLGTDGPRATFLNEALFVRTTRRTVALTDKEAFKPWPYTVAQGSARITPVYIRPMKVLAKHLDVPEDYRIPQMDGPAGFGMAIYSINVGWDIELDPLETRLVIRDAKEVVPFLAENKIQGPAIIWTSDLLAQHIDIVALARCMPVWCVCDTEPLRPLRLCAACFQNLGVSLLRRACRVQL